MEESKFILGQTVYSAQSYKLGRYVVDEFVTHETKDGVTTEVIVADPTGRKEGYSVEDINNFFFESLDEAKTLALQNWEITVTKVREQIENFKDEDFDEAIKKLQEAKEKKNQGK